MAGTKLTGRAVEAAEGGAADRIMWDSELRGFGLKLTKGGAKIYVVQYRMGGRGARTRRLTIGRHGSPWTPAAARREAERVLLLVKTGVDPQDARVEAKRVKVDLAFDAYLERFLAEYGRREWKPKTYASAASALRRWAGQTFGRKALTELKRSDVTAVLDRIPLESDALRRSVFAYLSRLFTWAVARGDIDKSPCEGMDKPKAVASRERTLNDDELRAILSASAAIKGPFGTFVRLLLLTGQRRDEIAGMRWEELDRVAHTLRLPGARTKNKKAHIVPLSRLVLIELDDLAGSTTWPHTGYVFTTLGRSPISGFSRMKTRLDNLLRTSFGGELPAWRLHDLRRSMATSFQRLGIRFEVTEAVLNHISGSKSGVAGVYQRHDWEKEKREALELWDAHLFKVYVPTDGAVQSSAVAEA